MFTQHNGPSGRDQQIREKGGSAGSQSASSGSGSDRLPANGRNSTAHKKARIKAMEDRTREYPPHPQAQAWKCRVLGPAKILTNGRDPVQAGHILVHIEAPADGVPHWIEVDPNGIRTHKCAHRLVYEWIFERGEFDLFVVDSVDEMRVNYVRGQVSMLGAGRRISTIPLDEAKLSPKNACGHPIVFKNGIVGEYTLVILPRGDDLVTLRYTSCVVGPHERPVSCSCPSQHSKNTQ